MWDRPTGDAAPSRGPITWRQLAPGHRIPVIAKTPLLIAVGAYWAGGAGNERGVWLSMAVASALWAVLYALNECTDAVLEEGYLDRRRVRLWLVMLSAVLVGAAGCVSTRLLALLALMVASQVSYCLPPLRLKRWWWAHVLLTGVANPLTRLHCGAIWGTDPIPTLAYGVLLSLHLGAAIRTRTLQRKRDLSLSYTVPPPGMEQIGVVCTAASITGAYRLCSQALLPPALLLLVTVGAAFAAYAWSHRGLRMAQLRRGWIPFALLSVVVVRALMVQPTHLSPRSHDERAVVGRTGPGHGAAENGRRDEESLDCQSKPDRTAS
jgi:hypothetical protein